MWAQFSVMHTHRCFQENFRNLFWYWQHGNTFLLFHTGCVCVCLHSCFSAFSIFYLPTNWPSWIFSKWNGMLFQCLCYGHCGHYFVDGKHWTPYRCYIFNEPKWLKTHSFCNINWKSHRLPHWILIYLNWIKKGGNRLGNSYIFIALVKLYVIFFLLFSSIRSYKYITKTF